MFFKLRDECTMNMNEDEVVAIETGIVGHKVEIDSEDFYMEFEKVDDSITLNRELVQLLQDILDIWECICSDDGGFCNKCEMCYQRKQIEAVIGIENPS